MEETITLEHGRTRLLRIRDVAERLGVSESTMRRRIASHELPADELGGRGSSIRIAEHELERWLFGAQA